MTPLLRSADCLLLLRNCWYSGLPHPSFNMTKVKDFVADLAKAGKGLKEIKEMADTVYGTRASHLGKFIAS